MLFSLAVSATTVWQYVLGSILLLLTVVLVVLILKQTGKQDGLSGTISGGTTETYFGKSKGASKDKILSTLTIVLTALFVVLTVILTIITTNAGWVCLSVKNEKMSRTLGSVQDTRSSVAGHFFESDNSIFNRFLQSEKIRMADAFWKKQRILCASSVRTCERRRLRKKGTSFSVGSFRPLWKRTGSEKGKGGKRMALMLQSYDMDAPAR